MDYRERHALCELSLRHSGKLIKSTISRNRSLNACAARVGRLPDTYPGTGRRFPLTSGNKAPGITGHIVHQGAEGIRQHIVH